MNTNLATLISAIVPIVWGSTYIVTTEFMPQGIPLTLAALRALPAGLLLLLVVRRLPARGQWLRVLALSLLNIGFLWIMLFVAAYRLPGGVAATLTSVSPLFVILLSGLWLSMPIRLHALSLSLLGVLGVALMVLSSSAELDLIGIAASLFGTLSFASGIVLTRKWDLGVSPLTLSAWSLFLSGIMLMPLALAVEGFPYGFTSEALVGIGYMSLVGGAMTYALWFWGISTIGATRSAMLGLLNPIAALLLGFTFLNQTLTVTSSIGVALTLGSVVAMNWPKRRNPMHVQT